MLPLRRFLVAFLLAIASSTYAGSACAAEGNRLAYLDESDPYYVSRTFPKFTTPQWVGEEGVDAVVVLAIDDMRGHEKWEQYLRPILERLKEIDGRAPVSIMTNSIEPAEPHLQSWLKEGLSLECHTVDHPCPLLAGGDFAKAKSTYDRCIETMNAIPNNRAVAFRMPCCDSLNTLSPRFLAEIFNARTPKGQFLSIDSSVFNVITADDPELPRELVLDENGQERFRRYIPFKSFVNTIEDYPYPYVIGGLCWEFPCMVPSDWSAQHVQQPNNPKTVEDWCRALDAVVIKRGVFNLVFHPHNWIRPEQVVQLIDHAEQKHGKRVKFLTFAEASERINRVALAGSSLRASNGQDNGVRLMDVNRDGYMDVVVGNSDKRQTRIWYAASKRWIEQDFPVDLMSTDNARFAVLDPSGLPTLFAGNNDKIQAWSYNGKKWIENAQATQGLAVDSNRLEFAGPRGNGIRFRDLNRDGICELIVANASQRAVLQWNAKESRWWQLPWSLPEHVQLVDAKGRDAGLRFVDVDEDGYDDLLFSNERHYSLHLFESIERGWPKQVLAGERGDGEALPMISRAGTNNGAWFHSRQLWVQNEDTDRLPDLVDRRSYADMLKDIQPGPKSPEVSLACLKAPPGMRVELMAAEPLVNDPVAFAWGPDLKLWFAEMGDYPLGRDGKGQPDGRVRFLEDTDEDGKYDKSTVFVDDLSYPTGVAPWRSGALIICPPEIFYAEDTDGDGKADKRELLYSGLVPGNPQHRANGLKWGMDGWLYCANGDSGGVIKSHKTGKEHDSSGRDFRIRPDTGELDLQSGLSQYGRNRDDWENWFGNNNSDPLWHYVLADHYQRRNPDVATPNTRKQVPTVPGVAPVYPRSRTLPRFNDYHTANRFTSANSGMIYRDELLGPAYVGNSFASEPVHNLVHREIVRADGLSFTSERGPGEQESEFLASSDNWFRPAMIQTGPDGALWVADVYRHVIEHPQWIPQEWQAKLDLRAGHDMGRLYRVLPVGTDSRPMRRLDKLPLDQLVAAMDSPNGWQRDMVQQLLVWRDAIITAQELRHLVRRSERATCRAQALCTLATLDQLDVKTLELALRDAHPGVRRHAVRLCEPLLETHAGLSERILELCGDDDPQLQLQCVYSLGEWNDSRAGEGLAQVALRWPDNQWMRAAVLSSTTRENLPVLLARVLQPLLDSKEPGNSTKEPSDPPAALVEQLVRLAIVWKNDNALAAVLQRVTEAHNGAFDPWKLSATAGLLEALARQQGGIDKHADVQKQIAPILQFAGSVATSTDAAEGDRIRALRLLGYDQSRRADDVDLLGELLSPQTPPALQTAAISALGRLGDEAAIDRMFAAWPGLSPTHRSQVLDLLLRRPNWTSALLAAIEKQSVLAADVDAVHRQQLLTHDDQAIRDKATTALAGAISPDRQKVIDERAEVLDMSGGVERGKEVFVKRCSVCHQLRGVGQAVGPDLAALTDNSPSFLLAAMLDPNRAVESKFLQYAAVTTDGVTYTGILANESGSSVTLIGQEGKQQTILRSDLEALKSTGKSLMPEGLEKDMSVDDLADAIAYLRTTGPARKEFPLSRPELVRADDAGVLKLLSTNCEIYGVSLILEDQHQNLGFWSSPVDRAVWNVDVSRPGNYTVRLHYACADNSAGNTWQLEAGTRKLSGEVTGTGDWTGYRQAEAGQISLKPGKQQIVLRSAGPIRGALLDLKSIELVPVK